MTAEGQGRAGELVAAERYRAAGGRSGADGIEPLATSFVPARCVRMRLLAPRSLRPAQSPVSVVDPNDRSDDRHPERPAGPLARSRPLPVSTRRRRELVRSSGRTPPNSFSKLERTRRDLWPLRRLQRLRRRHHCR